MPFVPITLLLAALISFHISEAQISEADIKYLESSENSHVLLLRLGDYPYNYNDEPGPELLMKYRCESRPYCISEVVACDLSIPVGCVYEWNFIRLDIVEIPVNFISIDNDHNLRLNCVSGLTQGGSYEVKIRVIYPQGPGEYGPSHCLSIAACLEMWPEGVVISVDTNPDPTLDVEFSVFPNPLDGRMLNVHSSLPIIEVTTLLIYDTFGNLVDEIILEWDSSMNTQIEFDEPMKPGMYTLDFVSDENIQSIRLIVVS